MMAHLGAFVSHESVSRFRAAACAKGSLPSPCVKGH